jgi:hypothetical protein
MNAGSGGLVGLDIRDCRCTNGSLTGEPANRGWLDGGFASRRIPALFRFIQPLQGRVMTIHTRVLAIVSSTTVAASLLLAGGCVTSGPSAEEASAVDLAGRWSWHRHRSPKRTPAPAGRRGRRRSRWWGRPA